MEAKGKPLPQIRKELLEREVEKNNTAASAYSKLFNRQISHFSFIVVSANGDSLKGGFYPPDHPELETGIKEVFQRCFNYYQNNALRAQTELNHMRAQFPSLFDDN